MIIDGCSRSRRTWAWTLAGVAWLVFLTGCQPSVAPPVEPDRAGVVLKEALDAWKQGAAREDLQQRRPPIYLNEPAWSAGQTLVDYEAGPVDLHGRQGRCKVQLVLRDKSGKETRRTIGYLIDTSPQVVITREGMGP